MVASNEHFKGSHEHAVDHKELESIAHERAHEIEKAHEAKTETEQSKAETVENARHELEQIHHETEPVKVSAPERTPAKEAIPSRKVAFSKIMTATRSQMNGPSRTFSKFIHATGVEKTSEVVGATVARPNAILSGAVFAFILTLAVYLIGHWFGYPLSGFETIGAFILGWVIGIIYDFLKVMITGKKA